MKIGFLRKLLGYSVLALLVPPVIMTCALEVLCTAFYCACEATVTVILEREPWLQTYMNTWKNKKPF
jgi:hypothetical protein